MQLRSNYTETICIDKSLSSISTENEGPAFRAYSFGHLKSAKSSERGRLRREKFQLPKEWEF